MTITNVMDAVAELRSITERAEQDNHRMGFFAALYTRVTTAMAARIREGFFDDGPRMDRLSAAFVDLYVDAVHGYLSGGAPIAGAWALAFQTCEEPTAAILEHIYLGMNAHVMVDLPVAAAAVGGPAGVDTLRGDFLKINQVVTSLMDGFHDDLCRTSPRLSQFRRFTGPLWEAGSRLVLFTARSRTFDRARSIAGAPRDDRDQLCKSLDREAVLRGGAVLRSAPWRWVFSAVRARESDDVQQIIRTLKGAGW